MNTILIPLIRFCVFPNSTEILYSTFVKIDQKVFDHYRGRLTQTSSFRYP